MSDASDANGHSNGQANGYTNGHIMSEQNNELNTEAAVAETAVAVAEPETSPHPATTQAPDITDASITTKSWTPQSSTRKAKKELGLKFVRRFTRAGQDPFETVEWELRTAGIMGEDGKIVFEQKDCEIPKTWSQLATNVVVSKYFRGLMNSPQRETSVRQVIGRVADTFGRWGREGGYFASDEDASAFRDELVYLLLHQYGSFNSPVWFNIGVKGAHQQASACQPYDALVSTPSGLVPIGRLVEDNAVGTLVFDARGVARIVATKCNGTKRVLRVHTKAGYTLDVTGDHLVWKATGWNKTAPTGKFVEAGTLQIGDQLCWHRTPSIDKSQEMTHEAAEAALAGWLQSDGFVGQYESGTNRSLTIEAMVVNEEEERWVRALIERVLPDVHSHTREVETQSADLQCRRIRLYGEALRPFVEKWDLLARREEMRVPQSLFTAPLGVAAAYLRSLFQAEGYVSVRENAVVGLDMISEQLVRDTQLLLGRFGIYARVRPKKDAREDRVGCASLGIRTLGDRERFAQEIGFLSTRKSEQLQASLQLKGLRSGNAKRLEIERIEDRGEMPVYDIQTTSGEYLSGNIRVHNCFINSVHDNMESIMELAATEARLFKGGSGAGSNLSRIRSSKEHLSGGGIASGPVSFMRGWDAFAGAIKSGGTTRRAAKMVILDAQHPDIEEFIAAKAIEEKKAWALIEAGYNGGFNMPGGAYDSVDFQNANHSVRASDEFMRAADNNTEWNTHSVTTGEIVEKKNARQMLRAIAEATHICGDPGMQYDTTINDWHTSSNTDRIYASNPCSEFLYLDDTACNLASMNLMKFRQPNGEFDSELFVHASEVFITAQEIIVSNASYPTEKIAKNSEKFRPLGLGYANLGALLMAQGTAYDSDEGRALAGAITAIIAANIGTFEGYKENREPMLRVIGKHRDAVSKIPRATVPTDTLNTAQRVWDEALVLGQKHGYRNAQATVLAPTGTIAFMMDCDTTGIEPDIALVKYKKLVGGGLLKIVNQTVPEALQKLGYSSTQSDAIIDYIDKNDTIEGAPGLKEEHLPVFDCAFKAQSGTRSIHYMGHIRMMAAAQPFISGAISKTVNVPSEASVDDILQAYMESWKLGLKAVAIYRDGSKRTQPLSTTTDAKIAEAKEARDAPRALRRKLPDERHSITHKFSIAGQEGYFTVGLYEDGSPGEIFIKMSKEGSTISGLMDSFAVAISMCLQYGVPLRVLVNKFSHSRFEPSGYTTNKEIPIAKSLMDYIFRWFDLRFHPNGSNGHLGKEAHASASSTGLSAGSSQPALMAAPDAANHNDHLMHGQLSQAQSDAPPCTECGTLMIRAGSCYKCPNCGTTSGCG